MDDVLDDLIRIARRCERAAGTLDSEPVASIISRLREEAEIIGRASSGGWLGYHANVYITGLNPKAPGDFFDTEWGANGRFNDRTRGNWAEYDYDSVLKEIKRRAQVTDTAAIERVVESIEAVFEECKAELLPTIDALLTAGNDKAIEKVREQVASMNASFSEQDLFEALVAGKQFATRDSRAMQGGVRAPPHVKIELWLASQASYQKAVRDLAGSATYLAKYLEKSRKMKGRTVAKTDGKIFIGHGRSQVWRDVKEFIQDRLGLKWDEFNREPTPGVTTKERLETMLDEASFALIIMTAEDERADKTKQARANVIHEAGLFQGRLGFKRAIVLLEEGCEEFSNIAGLGQIRFPAGQVKSQFEEIRRVLEREKLL